MYITHVVLDFAKSVFYLHGVHRHNGLQWLAKETRSHWIGASCERVAPGAEIEMDACATVRNQPQSNHLQE